MRTPSPLPGPLRGRAFTVDAAMGQGVTVGRLRAGDLAAPFRGIRTPSFAASRLDICRAYTLRMREHEAFSHSTAAELWGLPLPRRLTDDRRIHVATWSGVQPPRGAGVIGHRSLEPPSLRSRRGVRLVAPAEAWCQLASLLGERELIVAGDRLLGLPTPLATEAEIDAAIARYGSRRGALTLGRARLRLRCRSESPRETLLRLDVVDAGFPEPEPNGVIRLRSGRSTRGDLVFRRQRVILEYDGQHHREDDLQWAKDVDRLNELAADGWIVIRVNKKSRRAETFRLLRAALAR
ncbi:MAG: DUF559 domain-containing protein [Agromyces sp.]|nr:DUF559 domain-containing protein [Agromyces sp.]